MFPTPEKRFGVFGPIVAAAGAKGTRARASFPAGEKRPQLMVSPI
jgi:hypothetical protein